MAKCQCHIHYNSRVFPLPGKVISFFHLNLHNWDKYQKAKFKISLPVPATTFLILVFLQLFSKIHSRSTKKLSGLSFSQYIFQGREKKKLKGKLLSYVLPRCRRLIPKQHMFYSDQLALKSIGPQLKKVRNHNTLLILLLNGFWSHCIAWPLTVKSVLYTNVLSILRKLHCVTQNLPSHHPPQS